MPDWNMVEVIRMVLSPDTAEAYVKHHEIIGNPITSRTVKFHIQKLSKRTDLDEVVSLMVTKGYRNLPSIQKLSKIAARESFQKNQLSNHQSTHINNRKPRFRKNLSEEHYWPRDKTLYVDQEAVIRQWYRDNSALDPEQLAQIPDRPLLPRVKGVQWAPLGASKGFLTSRYAFRRAHH